MDFKNRFPSKPSEASRDPARPSNKQQSNNPFANTFSSVRQPSNPLRPSVQQKSTGLNKFKKAPSQGAAPKGQFKKYMVEANNIFYEDRPELKQLEKVKLCKWALIVIWLLLAVSYALIRRITPYEGVCPPKAKCGVFVRCPELFQYHKEINECRLSKDFLAEIQGAALSRVEQLQYDYGQRECLSQQGTPSFSINELFEELDAEKVGFYRQAAQNYLQTKENQENYGFKLVGRSGLVLPTIKKYSIRCSILLTISDAFKMMMIAGCLLVLVLVCWIGKSIMHRQRYSRMYDYLKDRVMQAQDKTLNVTHAMADLQNRFGTIDEQGWGRINDLRANDKKIGFYEDDFLYWKAS